MPTKEIVCMLSRAAPSTDQKLRLYMNTICPVMKIWSAVKSGPPGPKLSVPLVLDQNDLPSQHPSSETERQRAERIAVTCKM